MDERLEKLIAEAAARNPELVEKFGNPLDKNDPRNWTPTERAEKGLSETEQLRLLGLDMESQQQGVALLVRKLFDLEFQLDKLQQWAAEKMAEEFITLAKENPEKAAEYMRRMMNFEGTETNSPELATVGPPSEPTPDALIQTVDGVIRMDQIPGYVNDPKWRPSPDWLDANCMCENHQRKRAENNGRDPFGGTGMYL